MWRVSRILAFLVGTFGGLMYADGALAGQPTPTLRPAPEPPAFECDDLSTGGGLCSCHGYGDCFRLAVAGPCNTDLQCRDSEESVHCVCFYGDAEHV